MNKNKQKIAISIDADLLEKIDQVAEARGDARSTLIERMLKDGIESEMRFVKQMESPVYRALMGALTSSPKVFEVLADLAMEKITPEQAQELQKKGHEQMKRGLERSKAKKTKRKKED